MNKELIDNLNLKLSEKTVDDSFLLKLPIYQTIHTTVCLSQYDPFKEKQTLKKRDMWCLFNIEDGRYTYVTSEFLEKISGDTFNQIILDYLLF